LKLKYDNLLSSFAFKINLRRYVEVCGAPPESQAGGLLIIAVAAQIEIESKL
jgi:hypothetical protein